MVYVRVSHACKPQAEHVCHCTVPAFCKPPVARPDSDSSPSQITLAAAQEGAIEALLLEHQRQQMRALFLSANVINHQPLRQDCLAG